jgi:CheY-like chemotaxis protein
MPPGGSPPAWAATTAVNTPMQRVAIFEPAEAWRHWLMRELAAAPRRVTHVFDSVQALITALHVEQIDLLLVPFRVHHLDGTGWLQSLRASPGCAPARLIAFVAGDDLRGASLARLAGADQVFRKVIDAPQVAAALHRALGTQGAPTLLPSVSPTPQHSSWAPPLFDPSAFGGGGLPNRLDGRTLVFEFLTTMACHAEAMDQLYSLPPAQAQHALEAFAVAACQAGAWRVAQHAELMVTVLVMGGQLHPALAGAFGALLADTERELAIWLLEGPTPTADPMPRPGGAH